MESMCVAKGMTAITGQRVANNQEILAIGFGNVVSGLMSALPVCVSSSRSGLNASLGAGTRFSSVFNGLFVALIIFLFGSFVQIIPTAALSALLLVTATHLINWKQLALCLKSTQADAYVLGATVLASLFFSLDMAFYIGVVISIVSYLSKAAMPQLVEYAIEETGELKSLDAAQAHLQKTIRVIKVEGELFFGAADLFETTLKAIAENDTTTRVIILQLKNARDMDATTCLALLQLNDFLKASMRYLIACGMTHQVWDVMSNSGVIQSIGKENLFLFDDKNPQLYLQRALSRAKELAQEAPEPEIKVALAPLFQTS